MIRKLLLVGMAVMAAGCTRQASPLGPRVVVLADVSGSASGDQVRARYLEDFDVVVTWVSAQHGVVMGEVIGSNPTLTSGLPINVDFRPSTRLQGNPLYVEAQLKSKCELALRQLAEVLDRKPEGGTDIFSTLELAARIFERSPRPSQQYLVMFSDMLQSVGTDFYTADLSDQHAQRILSTLKSSKRLPDLSGVRVHVTGAGMDSQNQVSADRNFAVERFWRTFFQATGATLAPGAYGSRLVSFP